MRKQIIRAAASLLSAAVLLTLCSCAGNVKKAETHAVPSEMYSQEDIDAAIEVIKRDFKSWNGCTLNEIYYAGDEYTKGFTDWAARNDASEVIVLLSSFRAENPRSDSALNSRFTYDDWNWILVRENGGEWKHVDHGY